VIHFNTYNIFIFILNKIIIDLKYILISNYIYKPMVMYSAKKFMNFSFNESFQFSKNKLLTLSA
jgi:hypothetical protein